VISPEHAEEYTQALGQVVAGSWRHINLARRMGVPQALGLTLEEWVDERLGGYIRLSDAEFHAAVLELKKEGLKQREIAQVTGRSQPTVNRELRPSDSNESPDPKSSSHQAESAASNGRADSNESLELQPALIEEVMPVVSAAEAAIRDLLRRFTREELLAALEAVAPE
jgi:hypothetical protein